MTGTVEITDSTLVIDGTPAVLLCASVFPFRIPAEQWADRLQAVAELGYHCVDVYVPWNFHEVRPGEWDFTGRRDIGHFLDLAADAGLRVLARPGPYICSEWDGGGLPAWLGTEPGLRLRQNEPRYLAHVSRWFDQVMPILAAHQHTRGGAVVMVQLENELDFHDCDDPAGYVAALHDLAVGHGIDVPLVACAGQGDVARATGEVGGVVPAVNMYPSDDSADIETHAAYYESALRSRGLPLLVTETNRMHRTLKRLLTCGARLLGPYLQTSGWNYGYTTAVNNWGEPLAFMTHDYDFGGVIAPDGTERADAVEARVLAAVIDALGPRLAAARPVDLTGIEADQAISAAALALDGGGELLGVTNLGAEPVKATVGAEQTEIRVEFPAGCCVLLPRDVPLEPLDSDARLVVTDAELTALEAQADSLHVELTGRGATVAVFRLPGWHTTSATGDLDITGEHDLVTVTGSAGSARIELPDAVLAVRLVPLDAPRAAPSAQPGPSRETSVDVTSVGIGPVDSAGAVTWRDVGSFDTPPRLETAGVYCGAGRYETDADLTAVDGLVLAGVADIVDLRINGVGAGWFANPGTDVFVPLERESDSDIARIDLRVQIWGHSNFDDGRLPALRLGSLRGVSAVVAVHRRVPLDGGWLVQRDGSTAGVGSEPAPRGGFGGWMSARFPQTVRQEIVLPADVSGEAVLHIAANNVRHEVELDGRPVGTITPLASMAWLGRVEPGQMLSVTTIRGWGEPTGRPELLLGTAIDGWRVRAASEDEIVRAAASSSVTVRHDLPVPVAPGTARWVDVDLQPFRDRDRDRDHGHDAVVRLAGHGLLVTAVNAGTMLGRIWTEPLGLAALKGGRGDVLVVPRPWLDRDHRLMLRLESTTPEGGALTAVRVTDRIDMPE